MMVAIFGTMVADGIRDGAGIGYPVTTPFFAVVTAAIFYAWYRSEGDAVDPQHHDAAPRALLLGRGAGDVRAGHGGRRPHGVRAEPRVLRVDLRLRVDHRGPGDRLLALAPQPDPRFWGAYIVTRPLGASFADWFSKPTHGSLNLGDGLVAAVELVVFVGLVAYVARTKLDVQPARRQHHRHPHPIPTLATEPE